MEGNLEYYGVAKFKFISASGKSSGIIDTSSSSSQSSQLFLLIKPKTLLPKLNSTSTIMVSIKEDSMCTQTFKVCTINIILYACTFNFYYFASSDFNDYKYSLLTK